MHFAFLQRAPLLFTLAMVVGLTGCGQSPSQAPAKPVEEAATAWWCAEHGVPEAECSRCSEKAAAECKKRGDWCEKHDRADSQCFISHRELEAKFAARYEAIVGKKPPKATE